MPYTTDHLIEENQALLAELENAYLNMQGIMRETRHEKEVAYRELQAKFQALEELYKELSAKESILIHLEKLSSVGQFIAEIIHELNSPLNAIAGHVELIKLLEPPGEICEHLAHILCEVNRMSDYLHRFQGMVYKGEEAFVLFDMNDNVFECVSTLDIIKPASIAIELDLTSDALPVFGDPFQTNQVYLNLAKNAFDAMEHRGDVLRIATQCVSADWLQQPGNTGEVSCQPQQAWKKILAASEQFALSTIADNGKGIPPPVLREIFAPFFTTKQRGKGTGLGLSISSDIVRRHRGNLFVASAPGRGTAFQIVLPLASDEVIAAQAADGDAKGDH